MNPAQVARQEAYHDQVFRFKAEVLPDRCCVISAPADNKFHNEMAGCEFFRVYPWLWDKYHIS